MGKKKLPPFLGLEMGEMRGAVENRDLNDDFWD
jgi:hypothetical protein